MLLAKQYKHNYKSWFHTKYANKAVVMNSNEYCMYCSGHTTAHYTPTSQANWI